MNEEDCRTSPLCQDDGPIAPKNTMKPPKYETTSSYHIHRAIGILLSIAVTLAFKYALNSCPIALVVITYP